MSSKARKKPEPQDDQPSILALLMQEQQNRSAEEEFGDVAVLFCGMKRSGKTSLIDRFINPKKDEKDQPKPTVALDYKFARRDASDGSASKVLAHIYDLGGDEDNDGLIAIPVSPATVGNLVIAITLDLSEPFGVLQALDKWIRLLHVQVTKCLAALKDTPNGAKRVEALRESRMAVYGEGHPDLGQAKPFPVPLVIFGTKWDLLMANEDPEKRKHLCKALRFFAHKHGASLVFSSVKDKDAMTSMRGILRQLIFGVEAKGGLKEQVEASKPVCMVAGKDSFQNIGAPAAGVSEKAWFDQIAGVFPDPQPLQKGGKKTDSEQVAEELLKYPESSIDGMVEQRAEELQQYRMQVERNKRLSSEGIRPAEGGKQAAFMVG